MEELLAPVALYPDAVLGQVLVSSSNPQEVLDAGNWLLQNPSLEGKALDEAAKQAGFTAPMRGLLQFPETVDMMASQMDWTAELGQAFVNDQAGVLDAVQRLRAQAVDVGNLKSSEQMKVATVQQEGKPVVTVSPPSPEVVYVPQYDPVAAYAPPPATVPATTVPAATTTEQKGHSTGSLVATGLLSFGAGMLVSNIFDDDDDDWDNGNYYSPRYYGPPMPYYPPNPYRPSYGNGYYPSNGYNRPPNYEHNFNNNTVVINQNNNYWSGRSSAGPVNARDPRSTRSPISTAKPNRPELESLNASARDTPKRAAPAQPESWKNQNTYAGSKQPPKVQGTYAGGTASPAVARPPAKPAGSPVAAKVEKPAARPAASPSAGVREAASDRGRPAAAPVPQAVKPANRPSAAPAAPAKPSAVPGANRDGNADRAAAQRGKESLPQGAPAKPKSPAKPARPEKK